VEFLAKRRAIEMLPEEVDSTESSLDECVTDAEFRPVFEAQSSRVYRTLRALGVHEACLDDALQDVFLIVFRKLPSFVPEAQLSTWIYAITYRVAQNYRRRTVRTTHAQLSEAELCPGQDPESRVARAQAAQFVRSFCDALSEKKRDVFVLCVLEERSAPEVASTLGVKLDTVYSRLRLARNAFRAALKTKEMERQR